MDRLSVIQGSTFIQKVFWGVEPIIYKPITGITQTAPAVITAVDHGLVDGWPVAVVSVKGMTQINAKNTPPKQNENPFTSDYRPAIVRGDDTVELNHVNAAEFSPYVSGGYLMFYTPLDLTGYKARMAISTKRGAGGTEVLRLTTENGGLTIDLVDSSVTIRIEAEETAALEITRGVFDLEMVTATEDFVVAIMSGTVIVSKEVTIG